MRGAELTRVALDAAGQMALDEALLLYTAPEALILRFYDWEGENCTFGYSQSYAEAKAACRAGVTPVRRSTGGGIVFHDGDLTFSLVFPWNKTCAPEAIYKNIHRGIHQALKADGVVNGLWSPDRRPEGLAKLCFSRPEKMDLVDRAGDKFLGGALRKKGAKGLYQGSLRPEKTGLSSEALKAAVFLGVEREFGVPALEIRQEWLDAGRALEARYRSAEWNERR